MKVKCKYKEYLNKADTECTTPRCDLCWYKKQFDELKIKVDEENDD